VLEGPFVPDELVAGSRDGSGTRAAADGPLEAAVEWLMDRDACR